MPPRRNFRRASPFPMALVMSSAGRTRRRARPLPGEKRHAPGTSKLALIRYVSGEFAKARKPVRRKEFHLYTDKPINQENLDHAVATQRSGEHEQPRSPIWKFREHHRGGHQWRGPAKSIARPHSDWHGGSPAPCGQPPQHGQEPGPRASSRERAHDLREFPKAMPDLTPEQLKQILGRSWIFERNATAAMHWIDTLPPEMKKAITERHALLGMTRGSGGGHRQAGPQVRERDANGNDTED